MPITRDDQHGRLNRTRQRLTASPIALAAGSAQPGLPSDYGNPNMLNPEDAATLAHAAQHGVSLAQVVDAIAHKVGGAFKPPPNRLVSAQYVKQHPKGIFFQDKHGNFYEGHIAAGTVAPGAGLIAQTLTGLANASIYNPGGVEQAGLHPIRTAKQVAHDTAIEAVHPGAHPAQSALLYAGLLAGAGSAVARAAGAADAVRSGEGVAAAVNRPGHAGGSLLHTPEPGTGKLYVPGERPEPVAGPLEAATAERDRLAAAHEKALEKGLAPAKLSQLKQRLDAKQAQLDQIAARQHGVTRGNVAEGPTNATVVERPLSRNVVARQIQKNRNSRIQAALDKGTPAKEPRTAVGRFVAEQFSPQATVGREIRATRRVEASLRNAPIAQQQRSISGGLGVGKLTRGENAALQVIATEGVDAFTAPDETISRYIAAHERFIEQGNDTAQNRAVIADLKQARQVLGNPSRAFLRVVEDTRGLSRQTEQQLIARDHLTDETAAARREKIAAVYGRAKPAEDGFYYPMSRRYTEQTAKTGSGAAYSPQPREPGGIGKPTEGRYVAGLHKQFTGASVRAGERPPNVAQAVAARAGQVDRLHAAEDFYNQLWKIASPTRTSEHQIPIRAGTQISGELRKFFRDLGDRLHLSPDQTAELDQGELKALTDKLDAAEHRTASVGAKIDGVRWVDKRYLKDLGETSVRGPLEKLADAINNPARTMQLYLRPAYALNLVGNAAAAAVTEGIRSLPALRDAVRSVGVQGREDTAVVDSLMGNSHSRALTVRTKGPVGHLNTQLAEAWNQLTDLWTRRAAFYHEASRAGFKTADQRHALVTDPANKSKLVEVTRRANKNMIDYGSLTPLERNTISRAIYFYPFMSRASVWALRTLVEHPGKSFALGQLALIGERNANKKLGPLPAWARQVGFIPVGKNGDLVNVLNPTSVNNFSPAAEIGETIPDTVRGIIGLKHGGSVSDVLTPALSAAMSLGSSSTDTSGQPGGIRGILKSSAPFQALRRGGLAGKPSKTYPQTGVGPAVGPFAAGGLYPRGISKSALNAAAEKEARAAMSLTERAQDDGHTLVKELTTAARQHLPHALDHGHLPAQLLDALDQRTERYTAYAKQQQKLGRKLTEQDRWKVDVQLARQWKLVTPQQAAEAQQWAKTATDHEIELQRVRIGQSLFGGEIIATAKKSLRAAGADIR